MIELYLETRVLHAKYCFQRSQQQRSCQDSFYLPILLQLQQTALQILNKTNIQRFVCGFSSFNLLKDHDVSILKSSVITQSMKSPAETCSGANFRSPGLLECQWTYQRRLPYYHSPQLVQKIAPILSPMQNSPQPLLLCLCLCLEEALSQDEVVIYSPWLWPPS